MQPIHTALRTRVCACARLRVAERNRDVFNGAALEYCGSHANAAPRRANFHHESHRPAPRERCIKARGTAHDTAQPFGAGPHWRWQASAGVESGSWRFHVRLPVCVCVCVCVCVSCVCVCVWVCMHLPYVGRVGQVGIAGVALTSTSTAGLRASCNSAHMPRGEVYCVGSAPPIIVANQTQRTLLSRSQACR